MAGKGGRRKGAGRPKGGVSKLRKDLQELITSDDIKTALLTLRSKMREGDTDSAKYMLDQVFGKARQRTDLSLEGGLELIIKDFTDETNT